MNEHINLPNETEECWACGTRYKLSDPRCKKCKRPNEDHIDWKKQNIHSFLFPNRKPYVRID